ncbi:F-box/LRR-repeat protein 4 [Anopheles maculipalpis]|uniref:F-box/LRR-repeat protein 4 n=1 Tax=Anopheles maculipalpis TaxID=1496333 RepID=UPI002159511C|nr:F-box/LRR-repeat protein 4 [Anopheles maculipalpis]
MQQYAWQVIYASSQYGPSTTISYNAINVTGQPKNYPVYGEHSDSYLLPSYGNWRKLAPSYAPEFGLHTVSAVDNPPVDDFIVVDFGTIVCPMGLEVYETMNPGSIYRIWAYTEFSKWVVLWDKRFDRILADIRNHPPGLTRVFVPDIRAIEARTCVLRFEFCTLDLDYIPGIDGMLVRSLLDDPRDFRPREYTKFVRASGDDSDSDECDEPSLNVLPYEMIFKICSFLDLKSLRSASMVSSTFNNVVRDTRLYRVLNMRPYWMNMDSQLLAWLKGRCTGIRKLDLSWCGLLNSITARDLQSFLQQHGCTLTHLRLNSVAFPDGTNFLLSLCPNLTELCVQNMELRDVFPLDSKLTKLTRLDISGGSMSAAALENLLKLNTSLQHLNLSCFKYETFQIADTIGRYNRELISLNLFKTRALSAVDLVPLAKCTKLQELNLGYANHEEVREGDLSRLLKACPGLRKLVLAGFRDVLNNDLLTVAQHCRGLEYLDLMGCLTVSGVSVNAIFMGCPELRLLELHHCNQISHSWLAEWRRLYMDVDIKYQLF